eukprot:365731-Prymnesium_polylepis.1
MPCSLSLADMRAFASTRGIADKWLPEVLTFIEAVPNGATGKPARIGLAKARQETEHPGAWQQQP